MVFRNLLSKFFFNLIFISFLPPLLWSCGVYSFTGTNIHPDIKTFSVNNFNNQAAAGPANMPQILTEKLKEYFQRNTSLKRVDLEGDLSFEGYISSFIITPQAPSAEDKAGLNRLTISISLKFQNKKDEKKDFERTFSFYSDFLPAQSLTSVENQLTNLIFDQIVLDIFNQTVATW